MAYLLSRCGGRPLSKRSRFFRLIESFVDERRFLGEPGFRLLALLLLCT